MTIGISYCTEPARVHALNNGIQDSNIVLHLVTIAVEEEGLLVGIAMEQGLLFWRKEQGNVTYLHDTG